MKFHHWRHIEPEISREPGRAATTILPRGLTSVSVCFMYAECVTGRTSALHRWNRRVRRGWLPRSPSKDAMLDRLSRGQLVCVMDIATRCLSASTYDHLEDIISRLGDLIVFRKAALCAVRPTRTNR
jgi:hypothetical protein